MSSFYGMKIVITQEGYKSLKERAGVEGKHSILGNIRLPDVLISIETLTIGFIAHSLVRAINVQGIGEMYKTIEEAFPHFVEVYQLYQKEYNELYGCDEVDTVETIVNERYKVFSFTSMYTALLFVSNIVKSRDPIQNLMDYSPLNNNLRVVDENYNPIEEVDDN